jgi:hypothetical protein
MAVSVSVVTHSVLGFEFVIIGPGLLTRATRDLAFEPQRKTDVLKGGVLHHLDLVFGSVFRAIKDASETTGPSGSKKISMDRCWQLSISVGYPLGFQYTTHAHFDTQGAHR